MSEKNEVPLIPELPSIPELHHLSDEEKLHLLAESCRPGFTIRSIGGSCTLDVLKMIEQAVKVASQEGDPTRISSLTDLAKKVVHTSEVKYINQDYDYMFMSTKLIDILLHQPELEDAAGRFSDLIIRQIEEIEVSQEYTLFMLLEYYAFLQHNQHRFRNSGSLIQTQLATLENRLKIMNSNLSRSLSLLAYEKAAELGLGELALYYGELLGTVHGNRFSLIARNLTRHRQMEVVDKLALTATNPENVYYNVIQELAAQGNIDLARQYLAKIKNGGIKRATVDGAFLSQQAIICSEPEFVDFIMEEVSHEHDISEHLIRLEQIGQTALLNQILSQIPEAAYIEVGVAKYWIVQQDFGSLTNLLRRRGKVREVSRLLRFALEQRCIPAVVAILELEAAGRVKFRGLLKQTIPNVDFLIRKCLDEGATDLDVLLALRESVVGLVTQLPDGELKLDSLIAQLTAQSVINAVELKARLSSELLTSFMRAQPKEAELDLWMTGLDLIEPTVDNLQDLAAVLIKIEQVLPSLPEKLRLEIMTQSFSLWQKWNDQPQAQAIRNEFISSIENMGDRINHLSPYIRETLALQMASVGYDHPFVRLMIDSPNLIIFNRVCCEILKSRNFALLESVVPGRIEELSHAYGYGFEEFFTQYIELGGVSLVEQFVDLLEQSDYHGLIGAALFNQGHLELAGRYISKIQLEEQLEHFLNLIKIPWEKIDDYNSLMWLIELFADDPIKLMALADKLLISNRPDLATCALDLALTLPHSEQISESQITKLRDRLEGLGLHEYAFKLVDYLSPEAAEPVLQQTHQGRVRQAVKEYVDQTEYRSLIQQNLMVAVNNYLSDVLVGQVEPTAEQLRDIVMIKGLDNEWINQLRTNLIERGRNDLADVLELDAQLAIQLYQDIFTPGMVEFVRQNQAIFPPLNRSWEQSSDKKQVAILNNVFVSTQLESLLPGSVSTLASPKLFNIHVFARYPMELLINMVEEIDTDLPYGLVIVARHDHNGALYTAKDELTSLMHQASRTHTVRVVEVSNRIGLGKRLASLDQKYGQHNKIAFVVLIGHGSEHSFKMGDSATEGQIMTSDFQNLVATQQMAVMFEDRAPWLFLSCLVGAEGGIAQAASGAYGGVSSGPVEEIETSSIRLVRDDFGKPIAFDAQHLVNTGLISSWIPTNHFRSGRGVGLSSVIRTAL